MFYKINLRFKSIFYICIKSRFIEILPNLLLGLETDAINNGLKYSCMNQHTSKSESNLTVSEFGN